MDSLLVKRGFNVSKSKKRWIFLLGLIGFSSYGAYRLYHMPSVSRKRKRVLKLFGSLVSIAEMASDSAETVSIVSRDLKEFLNSDSDEIPKSLKQLSKIALSEEFSESIVRVTQAMTLGVLKGYKVESSGSEIDSSSFTNKVMDKLMSSAGTGFVSVIVGSFAKNLVLGFYGNGDLDEVGVKSNSLALPRWVNVVTDEKCRGLVADCIQTFVSTAVAVYLDKTMDVNVYEELFSGLTNPKHQSKMTDVMVSVCNAAVETLVKTSHHVLTSSKQNPESIDSYSVIDQSSALSLEKNKGFESEAYLRKEINEPIDLQKNGWVNSVSSTLAVPSNRKFVLDVTGRVTFETVRSVIEFLLWKISDGLKRSMNIVHDEVVDRGFQVVRYVGAKSHILFTVCLALFMHIVGNTQVLLPA